MVEEPKYDAHVRNQMTVRNRDVQTLKVAQVACIIEFLPFGRNSKAVDLSWVFSSAHLSRLCHGPHGQPPACLHRGTNSITGPSMQGFWWTKGALGQLFLRVLRFPLSRSLRYLSILIHSSPTLLNLNQSTEPLNYMLKYIHKFINT